MERSVTEADRVLVICTPKYVEKANSGAGGVGYEKLIINSQLVTNTGSDKFIPIIRERSEGGSSIPPYLSTRLYVDFTDDNIFDDNFRELSRALHRVPSINKPDLGKNPFGEDEAEEKIKCDHYAFVSVQNYEESVRRITDFGGDLTTKPQVICGLYGDEDFLLVFKNCTTESLRATVDEFIDTCSLAVRNAPPSSSIEYAKTEKGRRFGYIANQAGDTPKPLGDVRKNGDILAYVALQGKVEPSDVKILERILRRSHLQQITKEEQHLIQEFVYLISCTQTGLWLSCKFNSQRYYDFTRMTHAIDKLCRHYGPSMSVRTTLVADPLWWT